MTDYPSPEPPLVELRHVTKYFPVVQGFLEKLSGRRLFNELRLMLQEKDPPACIRRLRELRILTQIHPGIRIAVKNEKILESLHDVVSWWNLQFLKRERCEVWLLYLYGIIAFFRPEETEDFCRRMEISGRLKERIVADKAAAERALYRLSKLDDPTPSAVSRELRGSSNEALLFAMAKTYREDTKKAIGDYISKWKSMRIRIRGEDLKAMGIPPGPAYGKILANVLDARLDGKVLTRPDELALARKMAGQTAKPDPAPRGGA